MFVEKQIDIKSLPLSRKEIYASMGYGDAIPDQMVCDLVEEVIADAYKLALPRCMYKVVDAKQIDHFVIEMDGMQFRVGTTITSYLGGMTNTCVFVTTAGVEYEAYIKGIKTEDNILKQFVADCVGSVIAEECVDVINNDLTHDYPMQCSLPYSPGYCSWHIKEQVKLFSMFPERPCGIHLTDSFLMKPEKSISGFFALGKELTRQPYQCDICNNKNCYKKRN